MTTKMAPLPLGPVDQWQRPEHPDEADFKRLLRDARIARGLTHKALGDLCGFSHQYIHDIERGNRHPPAEPAVLKITAALGLGSDEIDYWTMCAEWTRVPGCWREEVYRLRRINEEKDV